MIHISSCSGGECDHLDVVACCWEIYPKNVVGVRSLKIFIYSGFEGRGEVKN